MGFGVVVQGLASHENYQARPLPALSAIGWVARLATTQPWFNLLLTRVFTFQTSGFADPCVFGEPLMRCFTVRTIGPTENTGVVRNVAVSMNLPVKNGLPVIGQRIISIPI
jgi:hypothetical protein